MKNWFDVQEGIKLWHERKKWLEAVNSLKDGRYIISIEKVQNIRSLEQNNTYWGIAYIYFEKALIEAGIFKNPSKRDIHEWCMVNCLPSDYKERIFEEWEKIPPIQNLKTGAWHKEPFRLTSTKMTTTDAIHYYENLQMCYAENFSSGEENDVIPDPDKNFRNKK